jgi:predicted ArsR family transcriptional regulator
MGGIMGGGHTQPHIRRLTVAQAADQLGISESAVRNRIKRGTLQAEREAGRVYVLLAAAAGRDRPTDESELVAVLREQLAAERQAHAEARRLLMAALERIPPQLEAPQEARESPETAQEEPERTEPRPATGGAQEGVQRSWWRRILGG